MAKKSIYTKRSQKLGEWLREQREAQGYSLRDFEYHSGWKKSIMGYIEGGHRRVDVVEFLELCQYLDCDPYEAIGLLLDI